MELVGCKVKVSLFIYCLVSTCRCVNVSVCVFIYIVDVSVVYIFDLFSYVLIYLFALMCLPQSAAGIKDGGRTGLTAVVVGVLFLLSLLFAPAFSQVPTTATAPVSILVGAMMMSQVVFVGVMFNVYIFTD